MKAIRVHAPGGPKAMRYEDAPDPTPSPRTGGSFSSCPCGGPPAMRMVTGASQCAAACGRASAVHGMRRQPASYSTF